MEAQRSKDTYVKKRKVGIETMLRPKPRMAMSSLNLTDSESRIIAARSYFCRRGSNAGQLCR